MSLKDQILAADDIPSEAVEVPEWKATVTVRGMTGADRSRLMEEAMDDEGNVILSRIYSDAVILCAYDPETGGRIFDDTDRDALMGKSGSALDRIANAAFRLSGMEGESVDRAGKGS